MSFKNMEDSESLFAHVSALLKSFQI